MKLAIVIALLFVFVGCAPKSTRQEEIYVMTGNSAFCSRPCSMLLYTDKFTVHRNTDTGNVRISPTRGGGQYTGSPNIWCKSFPCTNIVTRPKGERLVVELWPENKGLISIWIETEDK